MKWRPSKVIKDTIAMIAGMGLRTSAQAGVFLIVARVLGVETYGAYAAILALAGALGSFGGMGAHMILLRDVARDQATFGRAWGTTLACIVVCAPLLFGIYLLLAWILLPTGTPWVVITLIGLAELLFAPLALAGVNAYQGHERIGRAARLVLAPAFLRLVSALLLLSFVLLVPVVGYLELWSVLYVLAAFCAAIYSILIVQRDLGLSLRLDGRALLTFLRDGWPFAFGGAATRLYADIDKTLLARLSTLESAGAYSAGYRVVDVALVPVNAMFAATMPKFFRAGESNLQTARRYGWSVLPLPLLYSLLIGGVVYVGAPLLPHVLGRSYLLAVSALQWLSWLPLVSLPRLLLQSLLIGADKHRAVMVVVGAGALANILLNLELIPQWSWRGAVFSTYLAEVGMALAFIYLVLGGCNRLK